MHFYQTEISCGVKQISGVNRFNRPQGEYYGGGRLTKQRAKDQIKQYIRNELGRRGEIGDGGGVARVDSKVGFFFSDTYGEAETIGGRGLAAYLEQFGEVTQAGPFINYNTGRKIAMWTFEPSAAFMREARRG